MDDLIASGHVVLPGTKRRTEPFVGVAAAAAELGVAEDQLQSWLTQGHIPCLEIDGIRSVLVSEARAYLGSCQADGADKKVSKNIIDSGRFATVRA